MRVKREPDTDMTPYLGVTMSYPVVKLGMGWVFMSEGEPNRVEVLAIAEDGRLTLDSVANMLNLTRRQIFRLLKRYRQNGASAIRNSTRGKGIALPCSNSELHQERVTHAAITENKHLSAVLALIKDE